MRLPLAVLAGLFALTSAQAQPGSADPTGPYGVLGNAAPERLLFPSGADPLLSFGARLSRHVDVQVGYRSRLRETYGPPRQTREPGPLDYTERTRQRSGTVSAGYTVPLGAARAEVRASVTYEDVRRTRELTFFEPGERVPTRTGGQSLHTGASATVSLPLGTGRGGVAPSVGLAVSRSSDLGGTLETQSGRWMPFVRVPVGVRLANRATVALIGTGGVVRRPAFTNGGPTLWAPTGDIAVRVSF